MQEQVEKHDTLAEGATRLWQQSFGRGDRIPSLEINLLRDRLSRQQEAETDKNGCETNPDIFAKTGKTKIIPKTDMEFDLQHSMEENSLPDLIVPGTVAAGFSDQCGEALDISLQSPLLAELIDLYTYDQLETAFAACLQKLETLTGCQQPTDEQIQQLESSLAQMQSELVQMRQAMAKAFTTQKRTEKQYNFAQSTANNWEPRAQIALQKGNENLAKEALFRQKANASIAASLRFSLDWQLPLVDTLKQNIIELEVKIYEIKIQKELLAALIDAKSTQRIEKALKSRLQQLEILTNFDLPNYVQIQRLEWLISQMQSDLVYIRACTTKATTAEKNTRKQFYLAQSLANNWQRRARISAQNRDEAQVKEWSIRQKADADSAGCLKTILDLQTAQVDLLKYSLSALEITISQVKTEKELLKVSASLQNSSEIANNRSNTSV